MSPWSKERLITSSNGERRSLANFARQINELIKYKPLVINGVRADLINEFGMEHCRRYDCNCEIEAQYWDLVKVEDGSRLRLSRVTVHAMEIHEKNVGMGSITGNCDVSPYDLDFTLGSTPPVHRHNLR